MSDSEGYAIINKIWAHCFKAASGSLYTGKPSLKLLILM